MCTKTRKQTKETVCPLGMSALVTDRQIPALPVFTKNSQKAETSWVLPVNSFNPRTQETKAGGALILSPDWSRANSRTTVTD